MDKRKVEAEISQEDLDAAVGGVSATTAGGAASDPPPDTSVDLLKTKHDTVKNSISNVR